MVKGNGVPTEDRTRRASVQDILGGIRPVNKPINNEPEPVRTAPLSDEEKVIREAEAQEEIRRRAKHYRVNGVLPIGMTRTPLNSGA